jgi:hypothetical protein
MIDLSQINLGDEVILRLPTGQKILGQVAGDDTTRFVKTPDDVDIYFAYRDNVNGWTPAGATVIGHVPSMFGGEW